MSGIEVAGVVLGAFPLLISAMEHFEDTKKVTGTWWRIRRAHRRDLGRVKDCQLKFKLNLKELLLPLLLDGVVNLGEYEALLAQPGGKGWREEHVEDNLHERLSDCYSRYLETLEDMVETMAKFSRECRVDDEEFQRVLKKRREATSPTPNQQAQTSLMFKANVTFEAKRIMYSLTGTRREELLAEIEACNKRLEDVLASNDRLSALTRDAKPKTSGRINSRLLGFWRHAASIFQLLDSVWSCKCRSYASLLLQHNTSSDIDMDMGLSLCRGRQSVSVRLKSPPTSVALPTVKSSAKFMSVTSAGSSVSNTRSSSTLTLTAQMQNFRIPSSASAASTPSESHLQAHGLCTSCAAVHDAMDPGQCIGSLSDDENEYAVYPSPEAIFAPEAQTLADLLRPDASFKLSRVRRYGVALTVALSHLRLHSTPWLKEQWTCDDVRFTAATDDVSTSPHEKTYICTSFVNTTSATQTVRPKKDRSFSTLGIVLLELCFGKRLEEHPLWLNPVFAAGKADPMIRQAVACEWLDDVQGEAGEDYATAVRWTLKQAPSLLKDDGPQSWRPDFAQNVVQPLQRYYEYLNPGKGL